MKKIIILGLVSVLLACKANAPQNEPVLLTSPDIKAAELPLRKHLRCLPKEAAFVAGHRGTSKKEDLPENSRSSLNALINHGVLIAEVDVIGLQDGTHALFHDGVWEEKTTGKGPVASTTWDEAQKFLLKDTDGDFSADRLITLQEALDLSQDRLYLEIDFKSSAKYETVINMIRQADMADKVILIAYTNAQARKLAKLAPEMLLSVGASSIADIAALEQEGVKLRNMAIWMGDGPYEPSFITYLDNAKIPVLAWPREGQRKEALGPAAVAVTDYALQKDPIEGLSSEGRESYEACLNN